MSTFHDQRRHADLLQGLGNGQPVVFSHGCRSTRTPLRPDVLSVAEWIRCVAHDRRATASEQPWNGNDMNTYGHLANW